MGPCELGDDVLSELWLCHVSPRWDLSSWRHSSHIPAVQTQRHNTHTQHPCGSILLSLWRRDQTPAAAPRPSPSP